MKIGVIGYGYRGADLVRNFAEIEGIEIKRCADQRAERRALVEKRYPSINVTEEPEEIPADPEINAIVIATPVWPRAGTE